MGRLPLEYIRSIEQFKVTHTSDRCRWLLIFNMLNAPDIETVDIAIADLRSNLAKVHPFQHLAHQVRPPFHQARRCRCLPHPRRTLTYHHFRVQSRDQLGHFP